MVEIPILEDLGLSKREAKAYLALLELGSTKVGEIIKKTDIPSSKIYEVLDRLMKKGLVSYITIKHQKHFKASDPENILSYAEERKKKFENILPSLKEKQKFAKEQQKVELYEGKKAVFKTIYNLVEKAKKGDEYLSFSVGFEHDDPEIVDFYTNLTWRRQEKGLKIKVLTNKKIKPIYEKRYSKKVLITINNRYTSFNFPQGIIIVGDKIINLSWIPKATAIIIASKNLAEQYKKFFYEVYDKATL